jgi:membrane fusion protein, multidrug efflux system
VLRRRSINAKLNLLYQHVYPSSGTVAKRIGQVGDFVQQVRRVLRCAERDPYVRANHKETQLTRVQVGQPVVINVDALLHHALRPIDRFQRGMGSSSALLPLENGTGNSVKIVQRVLVKIPQRFRRWSMHAFYCCIVCIGVIDVEEID